MHILPGLDDGARTMEEAVEMARVAAENGTKVLLATPHMRDVNERASVAQARSVLDALAREAGRQGIPIEFAMGMETHVVPDLPGMFRRGQALPIGNTKYALVEMPFFDKPAYLEDTLFAVQLQGVTPVLAHPERIECIQDDPKLLARFVERGMLSQITGGSLLGHFGPEVKRFTEELLRRKLAHVMASDTHRPDGPRWPVLTQAVKAAALIVGEAGARALVVDTPKAILEGRPVEAAAPEGAPAVKRRWWRFGG
ncbi:MAG: hypothetical protein FJ317_03240 [SAR202 cluster bacterium]|nr:hypothetical protein [SAR202 cluster bacterium]